MEEVGVGGVGVLGRPGSTGENRQGKQFGEVFRGWKGEGGGKIH